MIHVTMPSVCQWKASQQNIDVKLYEIHFFKKHKIQYLQIMPIQPFERHPHMLLINILYLFIYVDKQGFNCS